MHVYSISTRARIHRHRQTDTHTHTHTHTICNALVCRYATVCQNVVGYRGFVDNDGSSDADRWSQVFVLALFALVQLSCLVGFAIIRREDRLTSLEEFTRREKQASLKL